MSTTAEAIVIGSGAFGGSVAFHLLQRGLKDVVLLDRHAIGSQTSARAAGNASQARGHDLMARIARDAVERFQCFHEEVGEPLDWVASGSLALSWTSVGAEMLTSLRDVGQASGLATEIIATAEVRELSPFLDAAGATAILHTPGDIYLEPAQLPLAYARAIEKRGGTLRPDTNVTAILRDRERIIGVETQRGAIHAPIVIDAGGGWARQVAEQAGYRVPLVPVRHQLLVTEPFPGLAGNHPIVRFVDHNAYLRPSYGGVLLGAYEPNPLVVAVEALPHDFQVAALPLDTDMLARVAETVAPRFAPLQNVSGRLREVRGGLPTMTPDGLPLIGPVPGAQGLFVLAGCCVGGFSISPAAGALLADLIVDGAAAHDLSELAIDRFGSNWTDEWLVDACLWEYSHVYDMRSEA